jgi:hypothetical protein
MKSILRKIKARTHEKLEGGIKLVLENTPQNYIENWFKHCGYVR